MSRDIGVVQKEHLDNPETIKTPLPPAKRGETRKKGCFGRLRRPKHPKKIPFFFGLPQGMAEKNNPVG
jgi:hypothetical protein